jgi:hypothetical protein
MFVCRTLCLEQEQRTAAYISSGLMITGALASVGYGARICGIAFSSLHK